MKRLSLALFLTLLVVFGVGCDAVDDEGGVVTLSGQVLNDDTNNPIEAAFVRLQPVGLLAETDATGRYTFDAVEVDSTIQMSVIVTKDGFADRSQSVLAVPDRTIEVPTVRMQRNVEEGPVSGRASNILLLAQSSQSIGVRESGSEEVAQITFQAADSLGRPVTIDNAVDINFSFGENPAGGAFLFPSEATTDNNGSATVNLSAGTTAGVVQVVATATVGGRTIRSLPVSVAIHGGLPEQTHFSVGPDKFNFPGLTKFGLIDDVSVIVGDKYANPVRPGTAVYFTSSHGVIEGSVLTNAQGRGSVALISANPLPPDGIATIDARTADEGQDAVTGRTAVVFSGVPVVSVEPAVARLDQQYSLTVSDPNNNPLAEGTVITVTVDGTRVKAVGTTDRRLGDTAFIGGLAYENVLRGPGITEFSFSAVQDLTIDEEGEPEVESITINVTGPNGSVEIVLLREQEQMAFRQDMVVDEMNENKLTVRMREIRE